jgi:hypothetical protein
MLAMRTHRGRPRLLAAVLWASAHALWGCTNGIAEPIFAATAAGAHSSNAGHGAAGQTAGNHSAADSGGAGSGSGPKSQCELTAQLAPPWNSNLARDEDGLFALLNDSIERGRDCAGHPFTRSQFDASDALRCLARTTALESSTWVGRPPSMQGPGHSTQPDVDQIVKKDFPTPGKAVDALLGDPGSCSKLMSPKYTSVGIGHTGMVWVVALGSD